MLKEESRYVSSSVFEGIVSVRALIENMSSFRQGNSENDRQIHKILCDKERAKTKEFSWLAHRADEFRFKLEICEREEIDDLSVGNTHGGLVAVCSERNIPALTSEKIKHNGFYVMLEGIEDPYNFGYAIRSLYAAGVDGIILGERNWMTASGVVCRASAGASELLPLYISDENCVSIMKTCRYRVVCADLRDSVSLFDADLKKPIFLIIGGEKRGISRGILEQADLRVKIDYGREFSASLSAASAATIAGYEIFRQNR